MSDINTNCNIFIHSKYIEIFFPPLFFVIVYDIHSLFVQVKKLFFIHRTLKIPIFLFDHLPA